MKITAELIISEPSNPIPVRHNPLEGLTLDEEKLEKLFMQSAEIQVNIGGLRCDFPIVRDKTINCSDCYMSECDSGHERQYMCNCFAQEIIFHDERRPAGICIPVMLDNYDSNRHEHADECMWAVTEWVMNNLNLNKREE